MLFVLLTVSIVAFGCSSDGETADLGTVQVPIWVIDEQCSELVEKVVELEAGHSADDLVGEVLAEGWSQASLEIERHNVTIDTTTGTAMVELYHVADSSRTFSSLSSCENFALFRGIKDTLIANEAFGIESVEFGGDAALDG